MAWHASYRLPRLNDSRCDRVFAAIHASNSWGSSETVSGPGSEQEATRPIRRRLPRLINSLGVRILLDAPCGDMNWISRVDLDLDHYYGVDVVRTIVEDNRASFGNSLRTFLTLDVRSDPLPSVDLAICRDLLVHLPLADGLRALKNLWQVAPYVLTTHYPRQFRNIDCQMGDWRPLNLVKAPFSLTPPILELTDGPDQPSHDDYGKTLALWATSD